MPWHIMKKKTVVIVEGLFKPTYKTADAYDSQYFKHTLPNIKWMKQMRDVPVPWSIYQVAGVKSKVWRNLEVPW